ncbi:hypothetical protein CEUSTIGMA_g3482.t1 [Chlamydomonas eustigma]|uniref:Uncharacterized protein n=1 Tax=Chlamydomonas eustigma TaxID=1157962 RepID=A0A250WZB5_9CHLO|nr:hypothetical protein CEUSTIGMA_g3482.t1 [Chlamydomonas eustigma]|eukprot:GAX76039.1 hypothetical protein CEUSTIGMA_g3482.t1 [Chlamydomonas eustigma]
MQGVSGASSFPKQAFLEQQKQYAQINLEKALEYCKSSSEDEDSPVPTVDATVVKRANDQSKNRPGIVPESDEDDGAPLRHGMKRRNKDKKRSKKKRKHSEHREREEFLRAERRAQASGLALPERHGGTVWAGDGGVGYSGAATLDKHLMCTDRSGDMLNLAYHCLHKAQTPLYIRRDPMRIARDAIGFRKLGDVDAYLRAPGLAPMARYYHARYVFIDRSRKLKRIRMRDKSYQSASMALQGPSSNSISSSSRSGPGFKSWGDCERDSTTKRTESTTRGRGMMSLPLPAVLPFKEEVQAGPGGLSSFQSVSSASQCMKLCGFETGAEGEDAEGETVEEYILRKTKEYNIATRERPSELQLWLDFSAFQLESAHLLSRRGQPGEATQATHEKRVMVLERALEHHPNSVPLMLELLEASAPLLEPEALCVRWQQALKRHKGSPDLWGRYLKLRKSMFPLFTVSRLQAIYADALHDLVLERGRKQREGARAEEVLTLEESLVRIALDLVQFELEAGYVEQAVARVQATLEFHCFNPNRDEGSGLKPAGHYGAQLRQFELFWESGAPRMGEIGAGGWDTWFRHENRHILAVGGVEEDEEREDEPVGTWGGWIELPKPATAAADQQSQMEEGHPDTNAEDTEGVGKLEQQQMSEEGSEVEEDREEGELEDAVDEDDTEAEMINEEELLERLGLRLEQDLEKMQARGMEPSVLNRWLQEEQKRDSNQTLPLRPNKQTEQIEESARGGPTFVPGTDSHSTVSIEDIRESVFPLEGSGAKDRLILGCLALLGAPFLGPGSCLAAPGMPPPTSDWACTNLPQLMDGRHIFYTAFPSQLSDLVSWTPLSGGSAQRIRRGGSLAELGGNVPWYWGGESRRAVLSQMLHGLIQTGRAFEGNPHVTLAYLLVEAADVQSFSSELQAQATKNPSLHGVLDSCMNRQDVHTSSGHTWRKSVCLMQRHQLGRVVRAKESAGKLLEFQRENVTLVSSLAIVQALIGKPAVTRRMFDSALMGASSPLQQNLTAGLIPILALQYADSELALAASGATSVPVAQSRALHILRWLFENGCGRRGDDRPVTVFQPYVSAGVQTEAQVVELVSKTRSAFADSVGVWILGSLQRESSPESAAGAAALAASMLHEVLIAQQQKTVTLLSAGAPAAIAAYRNIVGSGSVVSAGCTGWAVWEWLRLRAGYMLVSEQLSQSTGRSSGSAISPVEVRSFLKQSLCMYPRNPGLLFALEASEQAGHANIRLRHAMFRAIESEPSPHLLTAVIRAEAGRIASLDVLSGKRSNGKALLAGALDRVMERLASVPALAGCPLMWQLYMRQAKILYDKLVELEVEFSRMDIGRRIMLRAVRECPSCKPLWLESLEELNGAIPPREVSDLLEVARDKGVRMRTDAVEAMLQELDDPMQP